MAARSAGWRWPACLAATITEGADFKSSDGHGRAWAPCSPSRATRPARSSEAGNGDIVAVGQGRRAEGRRLAVEGRLPPAIEVEQPARNCPRRHPAVRPQGRRPPGQRPGQLAEEDVALTIEHDDASHELRLRGVNDEHLNLVMARLKRRYGVEVDRQRLLDRLSRDRSAGRSNSMAATRSSRAATASSATSIIEIRPLGRGDGFLFEEKIHGGAIPRQCIPAVEQGVRDALAKGPLGGFPVVDVAVTLIDGSYHSVDSSELAFRTRRPHRHARGAGRRHPASARTGAEAGRGHARPARPRRVSSTVATRRGQMLGMGPRDGWTGWDRVEALIPEAELSRAGGRIALAEPGPGDLRGRVRPSRRTQRSRRQGRPAQRGRAGLGHSLLRHAVSSPRAGPDEALAER